MFSTGAASAPDSPITILAPTHKVQALLRAFLSIPVDPDNPDGDKLIYSLSGLLNRVGGQLIHPSPLPPIQHLDQHRSWNSSHSATTHTAIQLTASAITIPFITTRIHHIMHTLDNNTDPHITHQTPSCIALHPHAIQTPISIDEVHTTPIQVCICPTKHTGISTIDSPTTSISGLKTTGPPPEPLTPLQLHCLQTSIIQAHIHSQSLTDNTTFIQFVQTGLNILPSGFISLHTLDFAHHISTGDHIAHYTQTDDITHYCHQLANYSAAQIHFIMSGHNHDPTQRIYVRPHSPDLKSTFAAKFGINTHAAFLPANCLVTPAHSNTPPPAHIVIPLIRNSFQLSTTLTAIDRFRRHTWPLTPRHHERPAPHN